MVEKASEREAEAWFTLAQLGRRKEKKIIVKIKIKKKVKYFLRNISLFLFHSLTDTTEL